MNEPPTSAESTPFPAGASTAHRPKRWRFSLATILLLLTILALVVSHVRMSRQLAIREAETEAARAEVDELRKEVGYLDVTDPKKLHIVAAPSHLDLDWKWKIYVPEGESFHVHNLVEQPSGGSVSSKVPLESGEYLVQFVIYKGPEGSWKKKLNVKRGTARTSVSGGLPDDAMSWVGASQTSTGGLIRADGTHQYEVDRSVILLNMTAKSTRPRDEGTVAEGMPETTIKVWIEPEVKAPN